MRAIVFGYTGAKRALVRRNWADMQDYADAKTTVVKAILHCAEEEDRRP